MQQIPSDGYLALPPAGAGRLVLVLHAWWGLNDALKAFCNRLAEAGFVAFAPDLYHGQVADTIPGAEILRDALFENFDQARVEVKEAAVFLNDHFGHTGSLAVIGFSLGAFFALELSVAAPELIRSVVVFYGTRPGDDYPAAHAAYLGHFAESDDFEPQSEVNRLEQALRDAGRPVAFYQYPGVGHWFFEPDRLPAYNPAAANLAWERTLAFLQRPAD